MYRILIAGAGYAGSAIGRFFKMKKQVVYGLVRTPDSAKKLEADGILPIVADLTKPETLSQIPQVNFVVYAAAPDLSDEESYRRIYLEGASNLIEALRNKPRPLLSVFLSSTSVWKDRSGGWVDESAAPDAETQKGKILARAEERFLSSGLPAIIFRLAGIYGPGRNRIRKFSSGTWPEPGEPDAYINMIHRDDIAKAMPVLFKKAVEGEVYLGVDDRPILRSEVCAWLAGKVSRKNPVLPFSGPVGGKRCRNSKLKDLGFEFSYTDFRAGYESFLKDDVQNL